MYINLSVYVLASLLIVTCVTSLVYGYWIAQSPSTELKMLTFIEFLQKIGYMILDFGEFLKSLSLSILYAQGIFVMHLAFMVFFSKERRLYTEVFGANIWSGPHESLVADRMHELAFLYQKALEAQAKAPPRDIAGLARVVDIKLFWAADALNEAHRIADEFGYPTCESYQGYLLPAEAGRLNHVTSSVA